MPRGFERETGGERDWSSAALALIEPHDDPMAILGPFDRLDDDIGLLRADQRGQR